MSITNAVLERMETRLPKVVDARTHGVIDYCHAAFFFGMAWLCRKSEPRAAVAAAVTGSFILVESLLTDYPLGVAKVIPFETHGRMDSAFAASSFVVPKLFGFEGTAASKIFKGNGVAESAVVAMTDFNSEHARQEEEQPFALAS